MTANINQVNHVNNFTMRKTDNKNNKINNNIYLINNILAFNKINNNIFNSLYVDGVILHGLLGRYC